LESSANFDNEIRRDNGITPIYETDNGSAGGWAPRSPIHDENRDRAPGNRSMHKMNDSGNLQTFHLANNTHSHVATLGLYTGKWEEYHEFRWQLGLYLTANQKDFTSDELMVIFALSYMKEGSAARWADAFMDRALEEDDWGTYPNFLDKLARDFSDKEEPRKALEQMNRLYQGKGTASNYFQKLEQLTTVAGIDIDWMLHILLQMEKGFNSVLIDQLYFIGAIPTNYREYKQRIIDIDDMQKRREANRKREVTPRAKNSDTMEVDRGEKAKETRKCYTCNNPGHLSQNCPNKEKRQDF
jgi:hypothetical protein